VFVPVEIDNHAIAFAVERDSRDPIAQAILEGSFAGDAPSDLWRHLIKSRHTVIDVGAHLGTYSLVAAAAAARVLAVEGSPTNAALLELAARRNSFTNLHVIQAVAAAQAGTVKFTALGPWGHVALTGASGHSGEGEPEVAAVALDDVIQARGWERVDLIKLDVEGFELEALAGLERTLGRDDAPPLLVEGNGHMLYQYGHIPGDMLAALERYGYKCHQIDLESVGRLVPVSSTDLQPECVADYFAFKTTPKELDPWWIDRPFERADVIRRVVATCQDENLPHREYGARLLASAPPWLLEDEAVKKALRALEADERRGVREALSQLRGAQDGML
jgi:FkbM family methyltransferase